MVGEDFVSMKPKQSNVHEISGPFEVTYIDLITSFNPSFQKIG